MREALMVLKQSGIRPIGSGGMRANMAPFILSLPNFLFLHVASRMIQIDPQARTSMWQDLQQGKKTEIDYINGEIVTLVEKNGLPAPINYRITALIKEAEIQGSGSPRMSASEMLKQINP
jgi:2-dehydropantoate 2-reductase